MLHGSLKDLIAEFKRYQPVCFRTTDPEILNWYLGGVITADVNSFLPSLAKIGITALRSTTSLVNSSSRWGAAPAKERADAYEL